MKARDFSDYLATLNGGWVDYTKSTPLRKTTAWSFWPDTCGVSSRRCQFVFSSRVACTDWSGRQFGDRTHDFQAIHYPFSE